jgi:predicted DNA-binding antitoxin AbrB/MazE fold protein
MSQVITATFVDGVLKPDEQLNLPARSRVRLIVEPLGPSPEEAQQAWEEFDRFCEEHGVDSGGIRLTRDQLQERH